MCTVFDGNVFFRPLSVRDLPCFEAAYPDIAASLISDLFIAMTDNNTVRPAVMAVILEGVCRLVNGKTGLSSHGATFAYSALQIHPRGNDEIFSRYQDPIMAHVHDAMLQFALAERNMRLVQTVLTKHGLNLYHFCDCGCGITRDGEDYMDTPEYKAVNLVRSYAESIGSPVIHVTSIDAIPLECTDMHKDEIDGYTHIWNTLQSLPVQRFDEGRALSESFQYLLTMKEAGYARGTDSHDQHPMGSQVPSSAESSGSLHHRTCSRLP